MPSVRTREEQKMQNRTAIVNAAVRVFSESGYEACTIRDIVRASGLAAGTFYNYFESKEEILESMLDEISMEVRVSVKEARQNAQNGRDFIESGYYQFFRILTANQAFLGIINRNQNIFRNLIFGSDSDTKTIRPILNDLKDDIQTATRKGYFRNINPDLTARSMIGAGFEILLQTGKSDLTPKNAALFLTGLFYPGLKPE